MTVIRCTSRLARRLRVTPLDDVSDGPGLLGDWYANTLYVGSRRYAVCISSVTLLPVIMPLRKAEFASRFPDHLRTSLLGVGVASHAIEAELSALGPVVYAKTRERSLIGSLNEFVLSGKIFLQQGESISGATRLLAGMPCSVLDHGCPEVATLALFSSGART